MSDEFGTYQSADIDALDSFEDRSPRPAISGETVVRALRTYEQWGGALRYLEKDKWHLSDIAAMRKVLEGFAATLIPAGAK